MAFKLFAKHSAAKNTTSKEFILKGYKALCALSKHEETINAMKNDVSNRNEQYKNSKKINDLFTKIDDIMENIVTSSEEKFTLITLRNKEQKKFVALTPKVSIDKENFNYLDKYPIKCLIHNKIVYKEPKIFLRSTTLNICSECQREQQISDAYKLHKHNERHYTSIDEFLEQLYYM